MQVTRVTLALLVLIRLGFKLLLSFAIPEVLTPPRGAGGCGTTRAEVRAQAKTDWCGTPVARTNTTPAGRAYHGMTSLAPPKPPWLTFRKH
jgi:hypothetical protein